MPFLRFTRDKRGYETTSLVHSVRGRQGRAQQQTLYWFRTPPNVKVGRAAIDEEAMRAIEASHPEIEFDWPTILEATPPPAAPSEEMRGRRTRKERPEARGRARQARPASSERPASSHPSVTMAPAPMPIEPPPLDALDPDPGDTANRQAPEQNLSALRARYAELRSRIAELGGERVADLQKQAEPLDPDSWADADAVRKSIEEFEPRIREIRAALGLRRRRRSRRGGRKRREDASAGPTMAAGTAAEADLSSKSSDAEREAEELTESED